MTFQRTSLHGCAAALLALGAASPGASAEGEILSFPFPGAPLSIFGQVYSADFLGPVEGEVVSSTLRLTFQTNDAFNAANLQIQLQAPIGRFPIFTITGAQLGWTPGAGTFTAEFETDFFNGPILIGKLDPNADFSLWLVSLSSAAGGPMGGQLIDSTWELRLAGEVTGDLNGDSAVDGVDLGILLSQWFASGSADLNDDGTVDGVDLGILLANWTL